MKSKKENTLNIFSIFGWIMGGLSLLELIEDLTPLMILGKLKKWLDAYSLLVDQVGNFLFGWIEIKWISISPLENHALVLAFILSAAYFRADYKLRKGKEVNYTLLASLLTALLYFLVPLILHHIRTQEPRAAMEFQSSK